MSIDCGVPPVSRHCRKFTLRYNIMNRLTQASIIEFPKICDPRGNLSFIEGSRHIPFPIKRVFYIYDVPGGETRGAHAHRQCAEVLIAVSGSLEVRLTDGERETTYLLNRSNRGLLIPPGSWRTMHEFTTGTVVLALCSREYEEEDYIRDFEDFVRFVATQPEESRAKI